MSSERSGCCLRSQVPSKTTVTTLPALETLHFFALLCFAFTSDVRIAPQPTIPQTRGHNPQKPWPMLRPRRGKHALELPAHAKLAPYEGDAVDGYLVYLHLDVKIGLARPEMIELGA